MKNLDASFAKLLAVFEQYPNLKSAELYQKFMEEAKPQTSEAAENFYAINQVAEQLQAFLDKHESLFDEIIGG